LKQDRELSAKRLSRPKPATYFFLVITAFFSQTIKEQGAFYVPAGDCKVSFVYVLDIASVATRVLTEDNDKHIGKAYTLTGPQSLTYAQAADILSLEEGKKIHYKNISEDQMRQLS
jgi:uncharacterized protein YbjT (DUF2867 family)